MSFDYTINAYFITTSSTGVTAGDFERALEKLRQQLPKEHIRQLKASDAYSLIATGNLTKKDVFVFDKFEGDFFKQLQQTKSLIVGPRCLYACLSECVPIPLGSSPIYTTAMRDLHISATGITLKEKQNLRELVQWMGGYYYQNFGRSITHLVSNTIKSTKYEHASLNGIPVMHVDWVQRVWDRSRVADVKANDAEFDKYRLPIFFGTNICCTGLETQKKDEVMRLVNENGGTYHRAFRSQVVDIVITEKSKTGTDKYQAAVLYKKEILLPEWVFDSVQKGFALPTKTYYVKAMKVSTPTKSDQSLADFIAPDQTNLSEISRISNVGWRTNGAVSMCETLCSPNEETQATKPTSNARADFLAPAPPKELQRELLKSTTTNYKQIYEEMCPKKAKDAGTFLDGCCIYLSGFRIKEREKLNRILNVGGATRYDALNEKITHIVVGQLDDSEIKAWKVMGLLKTAHIVHLLWLQESIQLKQLASEPLYRVLLPTATEPDAPSPSSKRVLRSMSYSFKQPELPVKKQLFKSKSDAANLQPQESALANADIDEDVQMADVEEEQNLIAQYSQENVRAAVELPPAKADTTIVNGAPSTSASASAMSKPAVAVLQPMSSEMTEGTMASVDFQNLDCFHGLTMYIDKRFFQEELYSQIITECEDAQGNVVTESFRDPVDYAVVSFEQPFDASSLPVRARHIITELYIEDCIKANKIVPILYFHKHIPHAVDNQPLRGVNVVYSLYCGLERDFLDALGNLLGANVNKAFIKKEKPVLVCPRPEGTKYEGALKWRYPVVTSDWLVQCAEKTTKLPFKDFLLGDSAEDFPTTPVLLEANQNATNEGSTITNLQNTTLTNNLTPTSTRTATDFTPLRNRRVSELAGGARSQRGTPNNAIELGGVACASDSPHTPPNAQRACYNFEYMEGILAEIEDKDERECLRQVIEEMRSNQTPELERIRRQACTPINRKMPTPKGIPEFCTTPEFQKRMADEFEKRWRLPTKKAKPDTPIDEIRNRIVRITCKAFGVPYTPEQELQQPINKPASSVYKKAEADGTPVTHMDRSVADTRRVSTPLQYRSLSGSDTFVPSTQTPNNSAGQQAANSSLTAGMGERVFLGKSTIYFDKISFEESKFPECDADSNVSAKKEASTIAAANASPEVQKITEYLKSCESKRQSFKQRSMEQAKRKAAAETMMGAETESHYVQPFESEQFGGGTEQMVGWKDPAEFSLERRRVVSSPMQYQGTPCFSISCSDENVRCDIIDKIKILGGLVSEIPANFDPLCTHFLCERPNRGEKMLGCISSGKWVLSLNYIEDCFAKGAFIDEELYEWGNNKAHNIPKLTPEEQAITVASHRWRKQLAATEDKDAGAFSGFRAILRISERNAQAIKNVLKAGKGMIIEAQSPYKAAAEARFATHCFVDVKKIPLNKQDYDFLRENGIAVYTLMYINAYLMNGTNIEEEKFTVKM